MATPPWCSRALPSSLVRATVRRDRQRGGRPALRPSIALGLYGHSDRRSLRPSQPNGPYDPVAPLSGATPSSRGRWALGGVYCSATLSPLRASAAAKAGSVAPRKPHRDSPTLPPLRASAAAKPASVAS